MNKKDKLINRKNFKKEMCYFIDNAPEKVVFKFMVLMLWHYKKYLPKVTK